RRPSLPPPRPSALRWRRSAGWRSTGASRAFPGPAQGVRKAPRILAGPRSPPPAGAAAAAARRTAGGAVDHPAGAAGHPVRLRVSGFWLSPTRCTSTASPEPSIIVDDRRRRRMPHNRERSMSVLRLCGFVLPLAATLPLHAAPVTSLKSEVTYELLPDGSSVVERIQVTRLNEQVAVTGAGQAGIQYSDG